MKIRYEIGDVLNYSVIAHGTNILGGFRSGVAGQIRKKYPQAYYDYANGLEENKNKNISSLGDVFISKILDNDKEITIYHCNTQPTYGNDGKQHVSYEAVAKCMNYLSNLGYIHFLNTNMLYEIAMPRIGAGLGGGEWSIIEKIIEDNSKYFQPIVVDWDKEI